MLESCRIWVPTKSTPQQKSSGVRGAGGRCNRWRSLDGWADGVIVISLIPRRNHGGRWWQRWRQGGYSGVVNIYNFGVEKEMPSYSGSGGGITTKISRWKALGGGKGTVGAVQNNIFRSAAPRPFQARIRSRYHHCTLPFCAGGGAVLRTNQGADSLL